MRKSNDYVVGIDIGTYQVKVIVAEEGKNKQYPRIIGMGFAESKGLRHGYIINQTEAVKSIKKALRQAEKTSGVAIDHVFMSVGGVGLESITSTGSVVVARADSEISDIDTQKAQENSQENIPASQIVNKKILHAIPVSYKVDGKEVFGNPIGLKGARLESKMLYVTCLEHHVNELIQAVEESGVEILDVMASPIAASLVSLTQSQKIAGCVLANIGAETLSLVVYEENIPVSLEVYPIGSNDITHTVALGLRVPLEDAEDIKHSIPEHASYVDNKHAIDELITEKLGDMFDLVENHLKKINRSGMLPAGIVITGGGSSITTIDEIARSFLKLPSRVADLVCDPHRRECLPQNLEIKDGSWSVAYGLCVFGLNADRDSLMSGSVFGSMFGNMFKGFGTWFKQFLP